MNPSSRSLATSITTLVIGLSLASPAFAEYRVAVLGAPTTSDAVAAQLNDDTHFDFEATVVAPADIDTADELEDYDVVVWGDSGSDDGGWTQEMADAVLDWATNDGGGVVSTSWITYALNGDAVDASMDDLTPVTGEDADDLYCNPPTPDLLGVDVVADHPVVAGIDDFTTTAGYLNYGPVEGTTAVVLAEVGTTDDCATDETSYPVVVADELGEGRMLYLGLMYQANPSGYEIGDSRTGARDQLLEQGVRWAAGMRDFDGDSTVNDEDVCPFLDDDQTDTDEDGLGDACEDDDDNDGIDDDDDNCPLVANSGQVDVDGDGQGDRCEPPPPPTTGEGGTSGEAPSGPGGAGGAADEEDAAAEDGGCGCATVGASRSTGGYLLLAAGLLVTLFRRRRA